MFASRVAVLIQQNSAALIHSAGCRWARRGVHAGGVGTTGIGRGGGAWWRFDIILRSDFESLKMPTFFVDDANFEATVDHLLQHGRFDQPPSRADIEELLRANLTNFYPETLQGDPTQLCECIYQSVFCMPCRYAEKGPTAYILNLVCRLKSQNVSGATKI